MTTWTDAYNHLTTTVWASIKTLEKRSQVAHHLVTLLGPKARCRNLTQAKIDQVKTQLAKGVGGRRRISPSSLRQYLGVLSKLVSVARDLDPAVPPVKMNRPPAVREDRVILTREDEVAIIDALEPAARAARWHRPYTGAPKPGLSEKLPEFLRFGWWIKFMLATGMRPSESFKIRKEDLTIRDAERERWLLHIPETKSGQPRSIPLEPQAREAWKACEPYGLWSDYEYERVKGRFWDPILAAAPITTRYTMYCLRHTYITRRIEAGMPIDQLSRLVGHSRIDQTMEYVHRSEESKFQAVEALERVNQPA